MDENYGFLSLLPPLIAIVLAIRTKQVYVSLLFGIWLGWLIIDNFNPLQGSLDTVEALVNVFQSPGNTRTIMFCALVGALIIFIQRSGGVEGFILRVNRLLEKYEKRKSGSNRIVVQFLAWLTGLLIFVESSISVLTVGALYRPVFDRLGISREKLAYLADSSSAPSSIIIPFNGWGAFIMTLLVAEGFSDPFATLLKAVGYNFYPFLALILALIIVFFKKDYGPMVAAERRVREEGKLLNDDAQPMISDELTDVKTVEGTKPKAYNMVIPITIMVLMMPVMLAFTGWRDTAANLVGLKESNVSITEEMNQTQAAIDALAPNSAYVQAYRSQYEALQESKTEQEATIRNEEERLTSLSGVRRVAYFIGQGSGSTAVLIAVLTSTLFAMIFYWIQGIMKWKEMIDLTIKGISGMIPLALLMMFAFAIGAVCKELGTGQYVADVAKAWLSPSMVPFIVFLVSCFIAFSTGTSWGTFAIMIAIAVPMSRSMDANVYMTIAAALGGGVFGDHCSPISDTTILSSMASATDHIDHVRTQLPYALTAGGVAALMYLIIGLVG